MSTSHGVEQSFWYPLSYFGYIDRVYGVTVDTAIHTWIVIGIILMLSIVSNYFLKRENTFGQFIVVYIFGSLYNMCQQNLPEFKYGHFSFIATLASFLVFSNTLSVFPFLEEPTSDLNTTIALALIAFVYIQFYAIKAQGIKNYIKHFFEPIFLMFPLHLISKFSMIISFSFRLYGNLLGGATISHFFFTFFGTTPASILGYIVSFLGLLISPLPIGLFSVAEGLIQAFVFTTLTLTFLSIETQHES